MQVLAREPPFTASLEFPFQLSCRSIDRVEVAVVSGKVNEPLPRRGRRRNPALGLEFPLQSARFRVHGIKIPVRAADINLPARHCGRTNHHTARVKLPFEVAEFRNRWRIVDSTVLRVSPKHPGIFTERSQAID